MSKTEQEMQNQIRELRADEIECRIGTISEKGLSLLLYKDARADMKILDEVFGVMNWQRTHTMIGNNLYCTVSVWDAEKGQWIDKMDVGTESYTEKEKGQASDAFKRACVSLGIGRELYTAPFIWISATKTRIEKKENKFVCKDTFTVAEISYSDKKEIDGLKIVNQNGELIFELKVKESVAKPNSNQNLSRNPNQNPNQNPNPSQNLNSGQDAYASKAAEQNPTEEERVVALNRELVRTGVALDTVLKRYGVASVSDMSEETYLKAMAGLKKSRAKAA